MKRTQRALVFGGVALLAAITAGPAAPAGSAPQRPANNVLARQFAIETGQIQLPANEKELPGVSGGVMGAIHEALTTPSAGAAALSVTLSAPDAQASALLPPSRAASQGCSNVFKADGGGDDGRNSDGDKRGDDNRRDNDNKSRVDNIRVNQDCTLRRQAEEVVAVNPRNPRNIVAGQNDSRIGFNHCGYDWSLDRASTWGDTGTSPPPFWQEILGDGHTTDACSDPSATFDHLGNAYVTGVFFDINSAANAILVAKSNAQFQGRLYHTPRNLTLQEYRTTPMGRVASDNDPNIAHDKELMIADTRATSPKRGRVYVTWTRFQAFPVPPPARTPIRSPIFFSQSTDGGDTWSPGVIISGANGSFCTIGSQTPGDATACDQDQGSDPVVGPDGTIYVIFGNGNTPLSGINQVLMVKCPPTNSCDSPAHWTAPVRIGDLIGTHPIGPSAEGCPGGRRCLPPNGYRVPEFTSMTISVDRSSNLYATWADFRNGKSPCTGAASTATPPCDNDVFYAYSTNRGLTWSPTINVTPRSRLGETAQWQPWSDVLGDGSRLQVAFYDRHYGDCEFTGCNDITLATLSNPRTPNPTISYQRITTSSMPNLTLANNSVQAGFLGDYMWVEVSRHNFDQRATHIVWADTRPLFGTAPEEDVYYARVDGDRGGDD